jgi:hypothetical protein
MFSKYTCPQSTSLAIAALGSIKQFPLKYLPRMQKDPWIKDFIGSPLVWVPAMKPGFYLSTIQFSEGAFKKHKLSYVDVIV